MTVLVGDRHRPAELRRPRPGRRRPRRGDDGRLRVAVADPGGHDPAAARGPGRRRPRADRHRQDGGVRAADPVPARPVAEEPAGAGPRADPRAGAAGVRGLRAVRRRGARREGPAGLRRSGLRHPAQRPAPRRARDRRDARADHGPPRARDPGPHRAAVPGPGRGRRDAQHGLRRGRRDDPRGHPRGQAGRALLGDHAGPDPPAVDQVPARPGRDHRQEHRDDDAQHHPALPDRVLPAEGRRAHPHPRGRELRGDDRLRPHQERDRDARREAAGPRLLRGRHQRRHPAERPRADRQPAQEGAI